MTTKWTPGPWRWHGNYLLQDCPARDGGEGKEDNPFSTPCGHPIADDGSAGGEYTETIDINGPDAKLIAKAPEMAEVLTELCNAIAPANHRQAVAVDVARRILREAGAIE